MLLNLKNEVIFPIILFCFYFLFCQKKYPKYILINILYVSHLTADIYDI